MTERFRTSFAVQLRLLGRRLAPCVRGLAVGVLVVHLVDERRVEFGLERTVKESAQRLAMVDLTSISASRALSRGRFRHSCTREAIVAGRIRSS